MTKHLLVLDLDGTIMLDFSRYDEETFAYLKRLKEVGHIIVLATGRPFRSSYFIYEILDLDTPLINYNGAYITNPRNPNYPITDLRIPKDALIDIINHIKQGLINVFCEIYDDIYVHNYNELIHDFLHVDGGHLHSGPLDTILFDHPHGALIFVESDYIDELHRYVDEKYKGIISSRYWSVNEFHIVEIYNPHVDKANGLLEVMAYYNIDQKHTIAIGDGHNDIGMIQAAGIGVAMKNSHPELIHYADYITASYDQQGVLHFLKSYFKI